MSVGLIAKAVVIAICAAFAAWGYIMVFSAWHTSAGPLDGDTSSGALLFALLGSFAIGLPVALLTYMFSAKQLAQSVTTLAMTAVLAGIMLVLASYVVGDEGGVLVLGIPAFIAAITYAVLGWFLILRPMRNGDA